MSDDVFHCLSIQQPWAWAVVSGEKSIENRSWTTSYRGPVVIQAGATKEVLNRLTQAGQRPTSVSTAAFGAMIGIVDLVDIAPLSKELELNKWAWGPYCWQFENPRTFLKAIPAKGKLKLYTADANISATVSDAVASSSRPAPRCSVC